MSLIDVVKNKMNKKNKITGFSESQKKIIEFFSSWQILVFGVILLLALVTKIYVATKLWDINLLAINIMNGSILLLITRIGLVSFVAVSALFIIIDVIFYIGGKTRNVILIRIALELFSVFLILMEIMLILESAAIAYIFSLIFKNLSITQITTKTYFDLAFLLFAFGVYFTFYRRSRLFVKKIGYVFLDNRIQIPKIDKIKILSITYFITNLIFMGYIIWQNGFAMIDNFMNYQGSVLNDLLSYEHIFAISYVIITGFMIYMLHLYRKNCLALLAE